MEKREKEIGMNKGMEGRGEELKKRERPAILERSGREKTRSESNIEEMLARGKRKERG